jgi:hypothetical protein
MIDPPFPLLPATLLAAAAKLGWRAVTRAPSGVELGTLTGASADRHLVIKSGGPDGVWELVDAIPPGFPPWPHLVARATYDILRGGTANDDHTITFEHRRYRLRVWYDGQNLTAEAVVEAPAA